MDHRPKNKPETIKLLKKTWEKIYMKLNLGNIP